MSDATSHAVKKLKTVPTGTPLYSDLDLTTKLTIDAIPQGANETKFALDSTEVRFTGDALYEKFKTWQQEGNEFERSKASFLDWLRLNSFDIPGITKRRPEVDLPGQPSHVNGQPAKRQKQQLIEYVLNLTVLRKHYHLNSESETRLNLGDSVEADDAAGAAAAGADAAGSSREHHGNGAEPMDVADDEEDDEEAIAPEERGRRMHARGEGPPSPHPQNEAVRRGYDEAVAAAAAAPAAAASSSAGASIVVPGVSAAGGAHGVPQTQVDIDRSRAERQARQQAQQQPRAKGKQRAHPAGSTTSPHAKKARSDAGGSGGSSGGMSGASALNLGDAVA